MRRKTQRLRGSRRHGWGKHHRGKGNKGGSGNAGRGKRSDHKKPSYRDQPLGKHGFTSHKAKATEKTITLKTIQDKLATWKKKGLVTEKNGITDINLVQLGYTKLLGNGKITTKMNIHVPHASKKTIEKIQAAGGEAKNNS